MSGRGVVTKRLTKELTELNGVKGTPPAGIQLVQADDFETWILSIEVLGESLYQGEVFHLSFKFGPRYPIDSPTVMFVVDDAHKAPIHPHVYSNGMICASILGNEWSPVLSVSAVCLTLQSMLASCKEKRLPHDNAVFLSRNPKDPKKIRFMYDDDTV
ncbi:hypothetical protein FRC03_011397 [Tulasnella sp. 419]|nr:hypothetical protein FRC02_002757 [Tulasnella sp. 418]KAG8966756.1 hypothetical protein FRC03_011397 [Tulasnella sp. 419]